MSVLRRACAAAALISLAIPFAATAQDEFAVPTYEGVYQPQDRDERGLWTMADEDERLLRDADLVIRDPALNDYIRSILCRTVGDDRCGNVRIYIVRVPVFNASMTPNGTMRINTGLLLRMRNEAELASVLGHEFAHFELRHTLANYRNTRSGSDLLAWTAVLGAAAATYGGAYNNNRDLQLAVLGGVYSFRRNQERDADMLGFGYIAQAGFRPAAAADVWRAVMNEADQTAIDRGRRTSRYNGVAFFASHPTNLERADTLATLANRVSGGDYEGRDAYSRALAPWVAQFLADELALNDFGGTDYLINRIAGDEYTADLLFARGELYRGRGHPRDLVNAAEFYRRALDLDPDLSAAWRGMGLSLIRSGELALGSDALRTYLEKAPEAPDAAMLRTMVQE
ncbi:putative Zn-dependent protease [Altererythrobacter atlanticus]|uniref:TPR repeat-containing protein YfgC n=1 Tax=Croceibacterium atlanticum TaxID=1267766 RepID=A0A0F7KUK2_9SPHN|nr:M48 family metallopeptidase [Croceibacterium atlanticum]AKH44028.1 TPR repeat-containing protein YfgC precursor [Croceibacterium atlanticum]MBB5732335.1 putative Zn-dependent protease [Croceibacterium atlanticum]